MKALHYIATTFVVLAALAILPSTLNSFRTMVDQVCATVPHRASTLDQADFWFRAFTP